MWAAVAAPVHGELLPARRRRARKDARLAFAILALGEALLQHLKHAAVVEDLVIVVHTHRVRAVVVDYVGRDALAEIGLEGVDPHVEQAVDHVHRGNLSFVVGQRVEGIPETTE